MLRSLLRGTYFIEPLAPSVPGDPPPEGAPIGWPFHAVPLDRDPMDAKPIADGVVQDEPIDNGSPDATETRYQHAQSCEYVGLFKHEDSASGVVSWYALFAYDGAPDEPLPDKSAPFVVQVYELGA